MRGNRRPQPHRQANGSITSPCDTTGLTHVDCDDLYSHPTPSSLHWFTITLPDTNSNSDMPCFRTRTDKLLISVTPESPFSVRSSHQSSMCCSRNEVHFCQNLVLDPGRSKFRATSNGREILTWDGMGRVRDRSQATLDRQILHESCVSSRFGKVFGEVCVESQDRRHGNTKPSLPHLWRCRHDRIARPMPEEKLRWTIRPGNEQAERKVLAKLAVMGHPSTVGAQQHG